MRRTSRHRPICGSPSSPSVSSDPPVIAGRYPPRRAAGPPANGQCGSVRRRDSRTIDRSQAAVSTASCDQMSTLDTTGAEAKPRVIRCPGLVGIRKGKHRVMATTDDRSITLPAGPVDALLRDPDPARTPAATSGALKVVLTRSTEGDK